MIAMAENRRRTVLGDEERHHFILCFDRCLHAARRAPRTLLTLGRDPARLGAQLAVTAVLHTWKRDLGWHPRRT
jgi:hypothetical protein